MEQALLKLPQACQSSEVRAFLSEKNISLPRIGLDLEGPARRLVGLLPGQGVVRTLYRTVTNGVEDIFAGQPMVDALIQRLGQQALEVAGLSNAGTAEDDVLSTSQASLLDHTVAGSIIGTSHLAPEEGEGLTSFTAPFCDLFVELFGLKAANNWLRRQAVLIILQQVLGGTIER